MSGIAAYTDYLLRNLSYRIPRNIPVIDIGSGHAPLIRADVLCDRFPGATRERAVASIFMPGGRFVVGDLLDLPFADSAFGFSFNRAVMEHLPDPLHACAELSRISRAGLVSVPSWLWETMGGSAQHLWSISEMDGKLVFRRKTRDNSRLAGLIPEHIRNSRYYEKFFMRFAKDFFIDHYWSGSIKAEVEGENRPAGDVFVKESGDEVLLTAKDIEARIQRGTSAARKARQWTFSLIRILMGGRKVDIHSVIACPACKNGLQSGKAGQLVCEACRCGYPCYGGVPVLLKNHAQPVA